MVTIQLPSSMPSNRALETARENHQATLIEAITYRLCDHTTADDASRYRDEKQFEAAKRLEPLVRYKKFLENEYQWCEEDDAAIYADSEASVKQAIDAYHAMPAQEPGEFFNYMFAKLPLVLQQQQQSYLNGLKHRG